MAESHAFSKDELGLDLQALLREEENEVANAVRVAPLVVVPADDLDRLPEDLRQRRIDDRGAGLALEIARYQFGGLVAEEALERAFGGGLQRVVHGLHGYGLLGDEGEIDDGDVRGRDAHGEAVELAGHLGDDELEGLGGAGGAGDHVDGSGASAAEVLVREGEGDLIVGVAVD